MYCVACCETIHAGDTYYQDSDDTDIVVCESCEDEIIANLGPLRVCTHVRKVAVPQVEQLTIDGR